MANGTQRTDDVVPNQDWVLARMLFEKFNMMHDFHVIQMKRYIVACCDISVGGSISINPEEKTVKYDIKTDKRYYYEGESIKERNKISLIGLIKVNPFRYKSQKKIIKDNLTRWTRRLLWADSIVIICVDGETISA